MAETNSSDGIHSSSLSWETILDEYQQALKAANKSQRTIDGYLENLKKYFGFLETEGSIKPISQLGKKELMSYVASLQNRTRWPNNPHIKEQNRGPLSPFAVRAYARDIKTFWSWLRKEEYIEENPLAHYSLPAVPEHLTRTITPIQFKSLLSHVDTSTADGLKYHCILLIPYDNGIRVSELVKITIDDIDFQSKAIKVMGKGQRERLVPITVFTRRHIIKYIEGARSQVCPEKSPYLFANSDGESISIGSVQQFMRRLLGRSGLKGVKFSPHILRHSFATQYLANGGNVFYLKAILGHKSLTTTLRYTQVQPRDIQIQHSKFSPVAVLFRNKS